MAIGATFKNLSRLRKPATALIAAGMVSLAPMLAENEGRRLTAYQDSVGVWTICEGITLGVKRGDKLTDEQCDELVRQTQRAFMTSVASKLTVPVTKEQLVAHTHFAYNIGLGGYSRSQTLKLTNAGEWEKGCEAMMNWYRAGGRDCRVRKNNCYGVVVRRQKERDLCLTGATHEYAND